MEKRALVVLLVVLGIWGVVVSGTHEEELAVKVKQLLDKGLAEPKCQGLELGGSCGDGVCTPTLNENNFTCPEDCTPGWRTYNKQYTCNPAAVLRPKTVDDVIHYVTEAARTGRPVKACGAGHSTTSLCCTDGYMLVMKSLNNIIGLKDGKTPDDKVVVVEAGVTLETLYGYLEANGRALGFALPGYRRMTVGGVLSTGSHGSSPIHNSVFSSLVVGLDVVTPWGQLKSYSADTSTEAEWKAVRAALGLMGVIVRVQLATVPKFNLHFQWTNLDEAPLLASKTPIELLPQCDYGLIHWWPHQGKITTVCGKNTTEAMDKGVFNHFICVPGSDMFGYPFSEVLQMAACDNNLKKAVEEIRYLQFVKNPYFYHRNILGQQKSVFSGVATSYMVVSDNGCTPEPWDKGGDAVEFEFSVPLENATAALAYLKKFLVDHEVYVPMIAVFIRFGISQDTTLFAHSVGRDTMFLEFVEFRYKGPYTASYPYNSVPLFKQVTFDLVSKFGARPHWGKTWNEAFSAPYAQNSFGDKFGLFQQQVNAADPHCMFGSEMSEKVIGITCPDHDITKYNAAGCTACSQLAQPRVQLMCGRNMKTYTHPCSAKCDGLVEESDLLPGDCSQYTFTTEALASGDARVVALKGSQLVRKWEVA